MNILCISLDGLHNGMIGAYGNAWIRTPAVDDLACHSVLFDRYYTDSMRLEAIFDSLWPTGLPSGLRSILLTDDDDVFHHAAADFTEKHRLELPNRPADEVDETQFFKAFATIVDLLERKSENEPKPFFLWTHLRAFRGPWDFPADYRQRYRDDEDPEPYAGLAPPELVVGPEEQIDPDDLQAVMEAYAGGVSAMDDALAGLLDWFEESRLVGNTLLVFLSVRGFSLGEHGRIGANETLYGENVQLPLLVRFPDGFEAATRCSALFVPTDLGGFLVAAVEEKDRFGEFKKSFQEISEPLRETLSIENSGNETALLTDHWFLRKTDERFELYVKPDDRWEANDVADRCPEVVEELTRDF